MCRNGVSRGHFLGLVVFPLQPVLSQANEDQKIEKEEPRPHWRIALQVGLEIQGWGGALCVEMGFYRDIFWESRCNIEINV